MEWDAEGCRPTRQFVVIANEDCVVDALLKEADETREVDVDDMYGACVDQYVCAGAQHRSCKGTWGGNRE